ncbi:MAG: hypothetical protein AAF368_00045 [Planctomycetota bacterium]
MFEIAAHGMHGSACSGSQAHASMHGSGMFAESENFGGRRVHIESKAHAAHVSRSGLDG